MKKSIPVLVVVLTLMVFHQAMSQNAAKNIKAETMDKSAASTYEHLASAIIAIEATEDELVKSILLGYQASAQGHLSMAAEPGAGRKAHLEAAATAIGDIANEGDKRILAIRQRLEKAGHTHNTDAVTKEDYLFINSKEKKEFLALAKHVGQLEANAKPADVRALENELSTLFDKAIAPE